MKYMKILSAMLAGIMLCEAAPVIRPEKPVTAAAVHVLSTVDSGYCGTELQWWLESDGTLTISGNDYMTSHPWTNYDSSMIQKVVIDKDVKSITDGAFSGCSNLRTVTIPDSVLTVGGKAFSGTKCYENVGGVHYIGSWLVGADDGITSASIRSGTTAMSYAPFRNIKSLQTVSFPDSLSEITAYAFNGTGLTALSIPANIKRIGEGAFKFCVSMTDLQIDEGLEKIESEAFSNCNRLTAVTIPASVGNVYSQAFYDCTMLTEIRFTDSETWIASDAFGFSNVPDIRRTIYGPLNSSALTYAVTHDEQFVPDSDSGEAAGCAWTFDTDSCTLTVRCPSVFPKEPEEWSHLKSVVRRLEISGDLSSVTKTDIAYFKALESLDLSQLYHLTAIENEAFRDMTKLKEVGLPSTLQSVGRYAFFGDTGLKTVRFYYSNLESIGDFAFRGCSSLQEIEIPDSVKEIGSYAFSGCSAQLIPFLPENLRVLGTNALAGAKYGPVSNNQNTLYYFRRETTLFLYGSGTVEAVPASAVPSGITRIIVLGGITGIGDNAFTGFDSLSEIILSKNVALISNAAFASCPNLKRAVILNDECQIESFKTVFPSSMQEICGNTSSTSESYAQTYNIPFITVTAVYDTFGSTEGTHRYYSCGPDLMWEYDCAAKTITVSGKGEMYDWTETTIFYLGDGSYYAPPWFRFDYSRVILKDGVQSIGSAAFTYDGSLEEIEIPESVRSIGLGAFLYTPWLDAQQSRNPLVIVNCILVDARTCTGTVTIPNQVTQIAEGAFGGTERITGVVIPKSVTSIGYFTFYECNGLQSITIPESVVRIDSAAFSCCENLKSVTILNPACEIAGYAMYPYYGMAPFTGTVYGYKDSTAEQFAVAKGFAFSALESDYTVTAEPIVTTATTTTETPIQTSSGDLNGDGSLTVSDAVLMCRISSEDTALDTLLLKLLHLENADTNGDGILNILDVFVILKKLAKP